MPNSTTSPPSGAQGQTHCAAFHTKPDLPETILLYNWVGLHGTLILARMHYDLLMRRFNKRFMQRLFEMDPLLLHAQTLAGAISSEVSFCLAPHQDGILTALWQLSTQTGLGLDIDLLKLPIRQETVEICEFFNINPYELDTQGCLLLVTKYPQRLRDHLLPTVPLITIGTLLQKQTKILRRRESIQFLNRPVPDALYQGIQTVNSNRKTPHGVVESYQAFDAETSYCLFEERIK